MFAFLSEPGADGVGVAFTDREGGASEGAFAALNLGRAGEDDPAALSANMTALRARLALAPISVVHQVHGTTVKTITRADLPGPDDWLGASGPSRRPLAEADALVTALPGAPLAIRVADCVPVLLADARAGVIGAAHAGRRGLLAGVLAATVRRMRELGATSIHAWVGPHICGDCYEVPPEMQAESCAIIPELGATTSWGTPSLDLGAGVHAVLERDGVGVEHHDPCTRTTPQLFSHRRDRGVTGRQIGLIWRAERGDRSDSRG
ncbi:Multi-copper polyphenol oxidoreductase laccase [Propionibacterium ruminifibrarum]|uniref:Multi-copper polyphenol oxidoreductase laccase n=1 Tax=Propionibacterium ruminifibrarum TaxID=1962131 RepID=A0A375I5F4_9ACTN|nr:polyphenol oxidase family protein [Propionibacterium ruminifibrarum]SPF68707.1 Multi-copper polyphenol oxidoreductase laccase [Propionibacterium ruminifibrarum]